MLETKAVVYTSIEVALVRKSMEDSLDRIEILIDDANDKALKN
jgi:hypothetical protein